VPACRRLEPLHRSARPRTRHEVATPPTAPATLCSPRARSRVADDRRPLRPAWRPEASEEDDPSRGSTPARSRAEPQEVPRSRRAYSASTMHGQRRPLPTRTRPRPAALQYARNRPPGRRQTRTHLLARTRRVPRMPGIERASTARVFRFSTGGAPHPPRARCGGGSPIRERSRRGGAGQRHDRRGGSAARRGDDAAPEHETARVWMLNSTPKELGCRSCAKECRRRAAPQASAGPPAGGEREAGQLAERDLVLRRKRSRNWWPRTRREERA